MIRKKRMWHAIKNLAEHGMSHCQRITDLEAGNDNLDENLTENFDSVSNDIGYNIARITGNTRNQIKLVGKIAQQDVKITTLKESVVTGHKEILHLINVIDVLNRRTGKLQEEIDELNTRLRKKKSSTKKPVSPKKAGAKSR